mgnify:FL=1
MQITSFNLIRPLVIALVVISILESCASKPVTHVPGYETTFYDERKSLAQNILKLVYFNRYVSDASLTNKDWDIHLGNKNSNHFAKQANSRASSVYKQLQNAANVDATRPFDQPNAVSWIEVDTLKDFGTTGYKAEIYRQTSHYLLASLQADIESNFDSSAQAASVEFSGDYCEQVQSKLHPRKIRKGEWIGSGEDVTCFINFKHEVIRPVLPEDWRPSPLALEKNKQYVIVRTRLANFEAFVYGKTFKNSFIFFPHKRTTHKRGRSITAGKGTPFMLHDEQIFLFAKPYKQNEAIIPASLWVYGNKLP